MNILVITQMYSQPDDVGDNKPTKTVNYFAREWVSMGHNVLVMHCPSKFPLICYLLPRYFLDRVSGRVSTMTPSKSSRKILYNTENGIIVFRLPMFKFYPGMSFSKGRVKNQAKRISEILQKRDFHPDIVAGHFANPSTELVSLLAGYYRAKSSIVFHHDCTIQNIIKYRLKKSVDKIGAIGARSILEAKQIQVDLNLDKLPFVCYSGAPNDAVEAADRKCYKMDFQNGIRHIYVGSLIKRKYLDRTIKAFISTKGPNDILTVIGGGPEEIGLKNLTKTIDETGSVHFLGRISRSKVLKEKKEAPVFTLISDGETFGMVYIEAMLQGCLVIASKGGGFDGIIMDGVNGFLCNPGDEEMLKAIYKKIKTLSDSERNTIGQNAIDTAIHFSEKEVAERYLNDILNNQKCEAI